VVPPFFLPGGQLKDVRCIGRVRFGLRQTAFGRSRLGAMFSGAAPPGFHLTPALFGHAFHLLFPSLRRIRNLI